MNGPFGMPWLTFSALVVIAGSVIFAALWARGRSDGGTGDE